MRSDGRCEQHNNPIVSSDGKCETCLSSSRTFSWSSTEKRNIVQVKTIKYECGCEIVLGTWSCRKYAPEICDKHYKPIKKIITEEEYF